MNSPVALRSTKKKLVATMLFGVALAFGALLWSAGFLRKKPVQFFTPVGPRAPVAAVLFSGDMGLRYGMGPSTSRFLAGHGIEVAGVSSPSLFGRHRSRKEVDAIVAGVVRQELMRTRAAKLVLVGQSFGADVLQTGLAHLPANLRVHVAAVILVVPGESVFFRADPTSLAYWGTPDSLAATTINQISWAPLTCIYGLAEKDSACPVVTLPQAQVIGLPGGHFLNRDANGLARQVFEAIKRAVPELKAFGT